MTPKLQDLVADTVRTYDVMCECGLHRVTQLEPQVCTRCGSRNLTITVLGADEFHELT
jgi:hypothetical protein